MPMAFEFVIMVLSSNRVKAAIFAFALAVFQKYIPDYMPDEQTMNWLYGVIVALIAGDTLRPVDPEKPSAIK